jgi:hypothetical protein
MFALLYTDGQLILRDIMKECIQQKWIPLLVYRENDDVNPILPVFNDEDVAKSFMKRNLPKKWSHGTIMLSEDDLNSIKKKGWMLKNFDFPSKIKDCENILMDLEIFELQEIPDLMTSRL